MKKILYIFAVLVFFSFSSQAATSLTNSNSLEMKSTLLISKKVAEKKPLFDSICGSGSFDVGTDTYYWMTFCHDDGTTSTYVTVFHHNEP